MLVAWYGHEGAANPFAATRLVRVSGGEGTCAVACLVAPFRKAQAVVSELTVMGGTLGETPPFDETGAAVWKEVYPIAGARALLLTYDKSTTLVCDSSIYAPPKDEGSAPSPFYEKIDLLVVPPSTEKNILEARARLRPRLIAVAAPCGVGVPSTQNILCGPVDDTGGFCYNFRVKNRKLRVDQ